MKTMKKFSALFLALVLVLAMVVMPASAAGAAMTDTGTITINNAAVDATYSIYRIFDLESTNGSNLNVYISSAKWTAYTNPTYFSVTDGYVTPVSGLDSEKMATFATEAAAYAGANSIAPEQTQIANSHTVTFTGLQYGYYIVVSSRGPKYSAGTLNNTTGLSISEKNEAYPTIAKDVDKQTADFGETLTYTITLKASSGSDEYKITDASATGVVINTGAEPIVKHNGTTLTKDTHYTLDSFSASGFTVTFLDVFRNTLADGDDVTVTYTAALSSTATVEGAGNTNTATLSYDNEDVDTDSNNTKSDSATVFTGKVSFAKKISGTGTYLADAGFVLYYNGGGTLYYAKLDGSNNFVEWTTTKADATVITTASSDISILGLAEGSYYLEETVTPTGYTGLTAPQPTNITTTTDGSGNVTAITNTLITIYNAPASLLPPTGGIGTPLFYTIGGILVLAALAVLISKKRAGAAQ